MACPHLFVSFLTSLPPHHIPLPFPCCSASLLMSQPLLCHCLACYTAASILASPYIPLPPLIHGSLPFPAHLCCPSYSTAFTNTLLLPLVLHCYLHLISSSPHSPLPPLIHHCIPLYVCATASPHTSFPIPVHLCLPLYAIESFPFPRG